MYTGHFAVALALKAKTPKAKSWALFTGVALLDFLFSPFIAIGWEFWRKDLVSIPWSHSLLMAILWGFLYAGIFSKKDKDVFVALFLSVISHFVLDFFVHPRHLVLYPSSGYHIGLALGQESWSGGWWLELLVILTCSMFYLYRSSKDIRYGRYGWWICGIILLLHILRALLNV